MHYRELARYPNRWALTSSLFPLHYDFLCKHPERTERHIDCAMVACPVRKLDPECLDVILGMYGE